MSAAQGHCRAGPGEARRAAKRGESPPTQAGWNASRRALKQPLPLHAPLVAPACEAPCDEQEQGRARMPVRASSKNIPYWNITHQKKSSLPSRKSGLNCPVETRFIIEQCNITPHFTLNRLPPHNKFKPLFFVQQSFRVTFLTLG